MARLNASYSLSASWFRDTHLKWSFFLLQPIRLFTRHFRCTRNLWEVRRMSTLSREADIPTSFIRGLISLLQGWGRICQSKWHLPTLNDFSIIINGDIGNSCSDKHDVILFHQQDLDPAIGIKGHRIKANKARPAAIDARCLIPAQLMVWLRFPDKDFALSVNVDGSQYDVLMKIGSSPNYLLFCERVEDHGLLEVSSTLVPISYVLPKLQVYRQVFLLGQFCRILK